MEILLFLYGIGVAFITTRRELQMKKRLLALLLCAGMVATMLVGCGNSDSNNTADTTSVDTQTADTKSTDTADTSSAEAELITIGFAQVGHESDWRTANTQNYQDVFSEANGYELYLVDCDNDNAAQLEAVRSFIEQDVDYIIIAPIETAGWDTVLQEAKDSGIPVIIADRSVDADASLYASAIHTDMVAEGETAGNWLAEYLNGAEAKILEISGTVGSSAALGRSEGFNNVMASHSEWTMVDSQSGDFTQSGGQEVMESFCKSYAGQFNVVVCHNDNEAYGAMDAMDAAGITYGEGGDVILISYDATHDGLQYTLDGKINCNVECNPLQATTVAGVIQAIHAGDAYEAVTIVIDEAFVSPSITSAYATTMTQAVLDARAY